MITSIGLFKLNGFVLFFIKLFHIEVDLLSKNLNKIVMMHKVDISPFRNYYVSD